MALRLGVFVVMLMWTLDKLITPQHAAGIFAAFYGIAGLSALVVYGAAAIELLIIVAFVLGIAKRLTYGAVLLLHGASTLVSFKNKQFLKHAPDVLKERGLPDDRVSFDAVENDYFETIASRLRDATTDVVVVSDVRHKLRHPDTSDRVRSALQAITCDILSI